MTKCAMKSLSAAAAVLDRFLEICVRSALEDKRVQ